SVFVVERMRGQILQVRFVDDGVLPLPPAVEIDELAALAAEGDVGLLARRGRRQFPVADGAAGRLDHHSDLDEPLDFHPESDLELLSDFEPPESDLASPPEDDDLSASALFL